jgi:hypothetical protein
MPSIFAFLQWQTTTKDDNKKPQDFFVLLDSLLCQFYRANESLR